MENKEYIGKIVTVKMDRQLGMAHPKHGFIYPVNYGYIPGTVSGDGEELDAYVLGDHKPIDEFTGRVVAIIHRINDNDDKLVVMRDGRNYSDEQIRLKLILTILKNGMRLNEMLQIFQTFCHL